VNKNEDLCFLCKQPAENYVAVCSGWGSSPSAMRVCTTFASLKCNFFFIVFFLPSFF